MAFMRTFWVRTFWVQLSYQASFPMSLHSQRLLILSSLAVGSTSSCYKYLYQSLWLKMFFNAWHMIEISNYFVVFKTCRLVFSYHIQLHGFLVACLRFLVLALTNFRVPTFPYKCSHAAIVLITGASNCKPKKEMATYQG